MGEENNKKSTEIKKQKVKEIIIDRPLTELDVVEFNSMPEVIITLRNTKNQNTKVLAKLNKNVNIRILGGFNEFVDSRYSVKRYIDRTFYSPEETCAILNILESIESGIDPKWTDLEKATYGYIFLMKKIKPHKEETDEKSEISDKPLKQILNGEANSFGYAMAYKELLDRIGIACRYIEQEEKHAWNEVFINGEYYPADLYLDSILNEEMLKKDAFELKNYLSNKEFYFLPEHQEYIKKDNNKEVRKIQSAVSLEHSEIQKAIDKIFYQEKEDIPNIILKSKELQKAFNTTEITSSSKLNTEETIKIELDNGNLQELREDIAEITKYYPRTFDKVTLANTSNSHINMQEIVNEILECRKDEKGEISNSSEISIESNFTDDFDIDFSKAPAVNKKNTDKFEDTSYSQKVAFVNTSGTTIKLPNMDGKIPEEIDIISLTDLDVSGFNIKSSNTVRGGSTIKLELIGGNTYGVNDLHGIDRIGFLSVNGIAPNEFDDLMNIALSNSNRMPRLFNLKIKGQNLANRHFLDEIKNPNIIELFIEFCGLDNIVGLDNIKNQLVKFADNGNNLSVDDLREIYRINNDNILTRIATYNNLNLRNEANKNTISDETYNYLNSYFKRSGYIGYRDLRYGNRPTLDERKKEMLISMGYYGLEKVPYFIEDAKVFRKELPFVQNPIMIKDLATFERYLNDPSNYFEQSYLRDGKLWLTKEQLESLINSGKTIPQNIYLKIDTVKDLTKSEVDLYKTRCDSLGLNLNGINVFDERKIDSANPSLHNFDLQDTHIAPYDIDEYKKIRSALDEIVEGINLASPDVEKFAVVYHRICDKISTYDDAAHGDCVSKEHAIYQAKMFNKSRNLSEGLIEQEGFDFHNNVPDTALLNRTVCAGYADILKNALDLVGIESVLDNGYAQRNITKGINTGGHEWNKVKIDDKWYYADACWDAGENNYKYSLRGIDKFVSSGDIRRENGEEIEVNSHYSRIEQGVRNEQMEQYDYDRTILNDLFHRVRNGEVPAKTKITISDDPDFTFNSTFDIERIKQDYKDKKNDMYAKFYGDKDMQRTYNEIATRYREHEEEVIDANGITYKTIQDYDEREEDEKFLLLEDYKETLERVTKHEAGYIGIYAGTPEQIKEQYEKDKEYVETRNHTFDQNKNTYKDLATLGKFGEKLPYVPKQPGTVKTIFRAVENTVIFTRNLVAPAYRFAGRFIAQPIHKLVTRGKDASPYKNNPYHRFVSRRDYFKEIAEQDDTKTGGINSIKNYITSNVNAVLNYKEGNEAVLRARAYDIQSNLKQQEIQRIRVEFYNSKKIELENQIAALENEIRNKADAENLCEAVGKLTRKRTLLSKVNKQIKYDNTTGKVKTVQTDAISDQQHDIASKEFNTYRVAAIKGVAKIGIKKFLGPKLKEWLVEHSKITTKKMENYTETVYHEKTVKDPSSVEYITEQRPNYDIEMDELIAESKNKTIKMYKSVSGGNNGEISYTIKGNEAVSGLHFQDGTKWGTGFSDNVPLMTDKSWPKSFLDASNHLRKDLTFSQVAEALSNGELSEEMLSSMTLQIEGKRLGIC